MSPSNPKLWKTTSFTFETFDDSRTTAACGLMREIGEVGQAIYLTHYRHVVDLAQRLCGDAVRIH